jgi:signal transduction histidine kinase
MFMIQSKSKYKFGFGLFLFCCIYWGIDSAWSYLSFEKNLSSMIFREPMSYIDTLLLDVPPYQVVSRIMVTAIFIVTGILIAMFWDQRRKSEVEKINLERQLQQSRKIESIGTLAGGIAHDFNNILYGTIGYTELCLDDATPGTQLYDNLKEALAGQLRAKELIKQILTFSRQSEPQVQPIQAASLVKEVSKLLRSTTPTTIAIEVEITTENSTILSSPTQIHQIIMNLSTNAIHAMEKEGGTLKIALSNVRQKRCSDPKGSTNLGSGTYLMLSVSDTGTGIPLEIRDRIFDPYFTSKEQGKGAGMGLAVVHGIVQSLNGQIEVASSQKQGTTFDIYLPLIEKFGFELEHVPQSTRKYRS